MGTPGVCFSAAEATYEWQVFLVAAQLVVLVVAAVVAWRQVREARELRLEQNRPFVVDFDLDESKVI